MPESGTASKAASLTTKKAKLGGSKKGHHPTQSKVVEKLTAAAAAQSPSRAKSGSKSPQPSSRRPAASIATTDAVQKENSPQPAIAACNAEPVVKEVGIAVPAAEKISELVIVNEMTAADEKTQPPDDANSATRKDVEQSAFKALSVDDIFPDMVWEDEPTSALVAVVPAAVVPEVANTPIIMGCESPQLNPADEIPAAVAGMTTATRAKKDKSPRRQHKAKSPAPKSISVAATASETSEPAAEMQRHQQLLPSLLSIVSCPFAAPADLLTKQWEESEQLPLSAIPVNTAPTAPAGLPPVADSPPPSPLEQPSCDKVSSQPSAHTGSQAKSKRKKNKSRSEDDPVSGKVVPSEATTTTASVDPPKTTLASDIKQIREQISQTLESSVAGDSSSPDAAKVRALEAENKTLKKTVEELISRVSKLETRVSGLEKPGPAAKSPAGVSNGKSAAAGDDDDDIDLFGSDDEEEDKEAAALREKRLAEYAAKKSKKAGPIAKSSVVLDVKPWDDETDMKELEKAVRTIQMDGLVWGASKLAPVAFNIKKLSIVCVVEDDKVSIEELAEKIAEFEDFVQSVDIAGFNKI